LGFYNWIYIRLRINGTIDLINVVRYMIPYRNKGVELPSSPTQAKMKKQFTYEETKLLVRIMFLCGIGALFVGFAIGFCSAIYGFLT